MNLEKYCWCGAELRWDDSCPRCHPDPPPVNAPRPVPPYDPYPEDDPE